MLPRGMKKKQVLHGEKLETPGPIPETIKLITLPIDQVGLCTTLLYVDELEWGIQIAVKKSMI